MADALRPASPTRSVLVGFGLVALAVLVATVLVTPLVLVEPGVTDPDQPSDRGLTIAALILNFVGFFVAGGIYLAVTDRGLSFVDVRVPSRSDALWIVAATVGSIAFGLAFGLLVEAFDLPYAPSEVFRFVEDRTMLFAMLGIVVFFNAPAEEFLFRNVIQKRLYEAFGTGGAIFVASLIFVAIHLQVYFSTGQVAATLVSLFGIFCGSLIFGYAFAKTENLVVSTVAHAGFNVFNFVLYFVQPDEGAGASVADASAFVEAALALTPV